MSEIGIDGTRAKLDRELRFLATVREAIRTQVEPGSIIPTTTIDRLLDERNAVGEKAHPDELPTGSG
ncbi:hypothetical protein [Mycobacteroides sp. PCS013]|uniref:hypothetical protein n=1 Tax=Mycobacteroides sp. PCS013 TaxID=3074106 RepID=UPI003C2BFE57